MKNLFLAILACVAILSSCSDRKFERQLTLIGGDRDTIYSSGYELYNQNNVPSEVNILVSDFEKYKLKDTAELKKSYRYIIETDEYDYVYDINLVSGRLNLKTIYSAGTDFFWLESIYVILSLGGVVVLIMLAYSLFADIIPIYRSKTEKEKYNAKIDLENQEIKKMNLQKELYELALRVQGENQNIENFINKKDDK